MSLMLDAAPAEPIDVAGFIDETTDGRASERDPSAARQRMKATRPQSTESATRETATWPLDRAARRSCALRSDRSSCVTAGGIAAAAVGAAYMDETVMRRRAHWNLCYYHPSSLARPPA